jgi:hypothetical protein
MAPCRPSIEPVSGCHVALVAEGQRLRHGRDSLASLAVSWLLITAVCGALLFRRRYPVAVGWFTVIVTGAYYLLSHIDGPLVVVPITALERPAQS